MYDFLEHAESTYLAQTLYRYDRSLVARELGEKKVYAIDTGLCNAVEYKFSEDRGKVLENAVFLELKRSGRELFYFRDQANECDFLCADRGHVFEAVHVCHDMSSQDTRRREVKGLAAACRQFSLEKGTIVVSDGPDTWEVDGLRIDVVPFYRFALSD